MNTLRNTEDIGTKAEQICVATRARDLKKRYKLKITTVSILPHSLVDRYGQPIFLNCMDDGFLMWFSDTKRRLSNLVFISKDLKNGSLVMKHQSINGFCYEPSRQRLIVSQANHADLIGNHQKALCDRNNCIVECDLEGKITNVMVSGEKEPFFPLGLASTGGDRLVYFDLVTRTFRVLAMSGEVQTELYAGDRIASIISASNPSEIYFKSISNMNWYGTSTMERADRIYKMVGEEKPRLIYDGCFTGPPSNQLFTFILCDDSLFYGAQDTFGKVDLNGNDVYKISMSDSIWQLSGGSGFIRSLCRDAKDAKVLYALLQSQKRHYVCTLEI
jgi:hypothetical protein